MLVNNRRALSCAGGIVAAGFLFCVVIINRGTGLISLEDDSDEPKDYYITAFPPGARKGVGPGLSFGDPVLNKYNKFRFVRPCVKKGNCPKPEDEAYLDWKSLKQDPQDADSQMTREFNFMASELEAQTKICEEGYAGYQEDIDQCSAKARRAICYRYEALSQICDESQKEQQNSFDGTKYFNSAYLLKSCTEDSRAALADTCKEAEKLPGVNVMHWPWSGHNADD